MMGILVLLDRHIILFLVEGILIMVRMVSLLGIPLGIGRVIHSRVFRYRLIGYLYYRVVELQMVVKIDLRLLRVETRKLVVVVMKLLSLVCTYLVLCILVRPKVEAIFRVIICIILVCH